MVRLLNILTILHIATFHFVIVILASETQMLQIYCKNWGIAKSREDVEFLLKMLHSQKSVCASKKVYVPFAGSFGLPSVPMARKPSISFASNPAAHLLLICTNLVHHED
jgi:hypothetical protein